MVQGRQVSVYYAVREVFLQANITNLTGHHVKTIILTCRRKLYAEYGTFVSYERGGRGGGAKDVTLALVRNKNYKMETLSN